MTKLALLFAAAITIVCAPAWAGFVAITTPTPAYTGGTSLLPFTAPDHTDITSVTDGTQVLSYDTMLEVLTVPATWTFWNLPPLVESSTPRVAATPLGGPFSLTITLGVPSFTFGFELEPDNFGAEELVAQFFDGGGLAGAIDLTLSGLGDARLFAATTDVSPFTHVTITNSVQDDFAIAQQRYGPAVSTVPEPSYTLPVSFMAAALAGTLLRAARAMNSGR